jgi:hypothetical protein
VPPTTPDVPKEIVIQGLLDDAAQVQPDGLAAVTVRV